MAAALSRWVTLYWDPILTQGDPGAHKALVQGPHSWERPTIGSGSSRGTVHSELELDPEGALRNGAGAQHPGQATPSRRRYGHREGVTC